MDVVADALDRSPAATECQARRLLSEELAMAQADDYDLYSLKELIVREAELEGLDERCAPSLASLEILSLSHNRLRSLAHFEHLVNLVELNLNFNRISSLEPLQCPGLEKLFAAGNEIADMSPLRRLPKLNTLSLYGNQVADLDAALHTCRSLPQLRALDLGGNPCSRELEGYKFRVVRVLPRLKTLDGDHVTSLDKELAEEFAVRGGTVERTRDGGRGLVDAVRPMTAPVRGALAAAGRPIGSVNGRAPDPFSSADMPRGNVRLFRDDFLNNNPILLEYLASGVRDESVLETVGAVQAARSKFRDDADVYSSDEDHEEGGAEQQRGDRDAGRGFVARMRTANPLGDSGGVLVEEEEEEEEGTQVARPGTSGAPTRPTTASTAALTSALSVDPSDPKATVRKLLKHIEVLMETVASYKNRELDSCREALLDENKQLRIENNNIPVLRRELEDLKKQLAALQSGGGASDAAEASAQRIQALERENASFRREVARLRQSLRQQQNRELQPTSETSTCARSSSGRGEQGRSDATGSAAQADGAATGVTARLGNSTLLDESAEVDVELTELILQNEVSLELIRNGIKSTKREWEEHFQRAKQLERERDRIRPSTSLGLASVGTFPRSIVPEAAVGRGLAKSRQLHTSAGGRGGPGEHLVRSSMPAAVYPVLPSAGSDSPDVLTL